MSNEAQNQSESLAARKARILADESLFQDACRKFVDRNVIHCVSGLINSIMRKAEAASQVFDLDDEDIYDWGSTPPDLDEALAQNDLTVFEVDSLWYVAKDSSLTWEYIQGLIDEHNNDIDEDAEDADEERLTLDIVKEKAGDSVQAALVYMDDNSTAIVSGLDYLSSADDEKEAQQAACDEYGINPDDFRSEVYEHWIVDSYFAELLRQEGHVVFEFENMTIWGRPTSGQAILLDGVVRRIVSEMPDYAYVWEV